MGAMAAFTAPRDRARNSDAEALAAYDPQAALAVLSGASVRQMLPPKSPRKNRPLLRPSSKSRTS